jgi:adenosylcobinamide kinase / adenosylcobinamide-phosphate guanylyltransferase
MAEMIFVTGGCRSGKSTFARKLAESLPGPRAFLATCPILDEEMADRVGRHREERQGGQWDTLEETVRLDAVLARPGNYRVFLLDCLSLWVNNLLYEAGQSNRSLGEADIERHCRKIISASSPHSYSLVIVSNEVGMGIVPDNALARQYRDLLGRANQVMAEAAGKVIFMVSGIPLRIKE